VSSMEVFHRATVPALYVELPTALVAASKPDPTVGEECWKTDLEVAGATSLHPVAAVDVSYATPQVHGIVNVALHQEYPPGIVFIFSQLRKDVYHV
jgi:hypothetical protein